jgi:hypothetical protein
VYSGICCCVIARRSRAAGRTYWGAHGTSETWARRACYLPFGANDFKQMGSKTLKSRLIPFLEGLGMGIIISWNAEIWFGAFGVVSTYIAPFGIAAMLIAFILRYRMRADD